jgi:CheY-like chemotaxis protein/Tfp pilus assembly protein PilZ
VGAKIKDKLSSYSKTILLVDDVPFFSEIAKDFFRRDQVRLLTATSGAEAMETIRKTRPDIVFLDLYMPGGDGDLVCKEIKSDPILKSIPVIILTGSNNPRDVERCQQAGCNAFIKKPLTREYVLEAYRKLVRVPIWSGKRVRVNFPSAFGIHASKEYPANTWDISVGGLFLETEQLQTVNSAIIIQLRMSSDLAPINCKGRVAWINTKVNPINPNKPTGMGVEFTDIRTLDLMAIISTITAEEKNNL